MRERRFEYFEYPVQPLPIEMMSPADFFLSAAGEYEPLAIPRACRIERRLTDLEGVEHVLVRITPLLPGQLFNLGAHDVDRLLISPRGQGIKHLDLTRWPCHVRVARVLNRAIATSDILEPAAVEWFARASLYPTLAEAS
jgi:hypothetical protein